MAVNIYRAFQSRTRRRSTRFDLIRGEVIVKGDILDDKVLPQTNELPTYPLGKKS